MRPRPVPSQGGQFSTIISLGHRQHWELDPRRSWWCRSLGRGRRWRCAGLWYLEGRVGFESTTLGL